ncbi:MAG: sigma-70 family RNA polymerase sigma factor [Planctomycetes bacterium]|nr:sigma-70 family RNA polymerase sigma factor [Planctomycetota bacterium]
MVFPYDGDGCASDSLDPRVPVWETVYRELRSLAAGFLARDRHARTLQPTALVHEAFLRLHGSANIAHMDRLEFCRAAASAMRRILIDQARSRMRRKRGAGRRAAADIDLDELEGGVDLERVLELEDALVELEALSPRRAEVMRLRFFAGLEENEVAELVGTSRRTVQYDVRAARAWLRVALCERAEGPAEAPRELEARAKEDP